LDGRGGSIKEGVMQRRRFYAVCLACTAALSLGCGKQTEKKAAENATEARGPERTEERPIQKFEGVIADGRVHVRIAKGTSSEARLIGPTNYIEHIELKREERELDGRKIEVLLIRLQKAVKMPLPVIEVATTSLHYVEATGPARVDIDNLSGPALSLKAGEAARIEMKPAAYGLLRVETKMAARVLGPEVMVESAEASAYDFSFVQLGQVAELKKNEQGGKISYKGTPTLIHP
jgi:hypothetical protein